MALTKRKIEEAHANCKNANAPQKKFKIGSSIKTFTGNMKEVFLRVEMVGGDIVLYTKGGSRKAKRELITDGDTQYFMYQGTKYTRPAI